LRTERDNSKRQDSDRARHFVPVTAKMASFDELHNAIEGCLRLISRNHHDDNALPQGEVTVEHRSSMEHDSFSSLSHSQSQQSNAMPNKRLKKAHKALHHQSGNDRFQGYERRRAMRRLERAITSVSDDLEREGHNGEGEEQSEEPSIEPTMMPPAVTADLMVVLTTIVPQLLDMGNREMGGAGHGFLEDCCESILSCSTDLILGRATLPLSTDNLELLMDQIATICMGRGQKVTCSGDENLSVVDLYLEKSLMLVNTSIWHAQNGEDEVENVSIACFRVGPDESVQLASIVLQCYLDGFSFGRENLSVSHENLRTQLVVFCTTLLGHLPEILDKSEETFNETLLEEVLDASLAFMIDITDVAIDSVDVFLMTRPASQDEESVIQTVIDSASMAVHFMEVMVSFGEYSMVCPLEVQHAFLDSLSQLLVAGQKDELTSANGNRVVIEHNIRALVKDLYLRSFKMLTCDDSSWGTQPEWMQVASGLALLLSNEGTCSSDNRQDDLLCFGRSLEREGPSILELEKMVQLCALSSTCMPVDSQHTLRDETAQDILMGLLAKPSTIQTTNNPWHCLLARKVAERENCDNVNKGSESAGCSSDRGNSSLSRYVDAVCL
jgi:hypothetical protein